MKNTIKKITISTGGLAAALLKPCRYATPLQAQNTKNYNA